VIFITNDCIFSKRASPIMLWLQGIQIKVEQARKWFLYLFHYSFDALVWSVFIYLCAWAAGKCVYLFSFSFQLNFH